MSVSGISSTGTSAMSSSRQTIAENFDTFLQLLTTQLRNQNPLDPLDTNQFTQQLVQFTSVEQQLKTNEFLEAMMLAGANSGINNAVNYIGKQVTASGVRSELVNGSATWSFALQDTADVTVTIKDTAGNTVYTEEGRLTAGVGQFAWDGIGNDGQRKPDGTYSITIAGRNADGQYVPITTETTGVVSGVDFTGSEPVLIVGTSRLNLSSVTSVRQPPA
ncbi:flagellar hook assembly protein FlgD [Arsenicitalea aurantiaca]|uniref:Basal-body rod modification protein FlgD n=1 Tax=Arsenicitalea aurantiaca TaxID=1783274 RepID=A0A433XKW5_9HYPH|nr:flagellar hook capping FlgD N-terminal domain-containing protein [Arsenicitalea aurantiaca]RUT34722.1 flagellar hook assembly protein FlgD [Arsenicitalea aurantiaca]